MKKILTFTLVLALTAFIFSSCSKDKKENEELKTLEGTSWATTGPQTIGSDTHEVELNFIDGKSFTLSHILGSATYNFEGNYVYEKPNITLNAELVASGDRHTFKGTINGKTMTLNLGSMGEIPIVLNMK